MICVLIPVYCPEESFVPFVKHLDEALKKNFNESDYKIIIVNDGNDTQSSLFSTLQNGCNADIVHHAVNQGKGRALKTGINHILLHYPNCTKCVTCDADGQHDIPDILNIVNASQESATLSLGVRQFSNKSIPFRSRFGNCLTRVLFTLLTGLNIQDTQTGLRAFTMDFIKQCMTIEGERYEYETNMLLYCKTHSIPIIQIPIKTIYLDNNSASHFNPLLDSIKIYKLLFKFAFSSLFASILDFVIFSILYFFTKRLFISMAVARVTSVGFNFFVNKNFVFNKKYKKIKSFILYCLLALFLFITSYFGIRLLGNIFDIPVYVLKIIVELILFLISYTIQRDVIFK